MSRAGIPVRKGGEGVKAQAVVAAALGVTLIAGTGWYFYDRTVGQSPGPAPVASPAAPDPVTTMAPNGVAPSATAIEPASSTTAVPGPIAEPTSAVEPAPSDEDVSIGDLAASLTPEQEASSLAFATQLAVALSTQNPDESLGRRTRLLPFFVPDSAGIRRAGPALEGSTTSPVAVDWASRFDPGNADELGILISIKFDLSEPTAAGRESFRAANAIWRIRLVRSGASWLGSGAELGSTTA
jgi:hypothetical protein